MNIRPHSSTRSGFTIIELMIAVAIITLISSMGVPYVMNAINNVNQQRFAEDMNTISEGILYGLMFSIDADEVPEATVPSEIASYLPGNIDFKSTPIGGVWDFEGPLALEHHGIRYGLSVNKPRLNEAEMSRIDAKIDDGNLSTGTFRKTATAKYTLELLSL